MVYHPLIHVRIGRCRVSPLWLPGFHAASLEDVQVRCVDEIDLSTTRQNLMQAFRIVLDCLAAAGVTCEIWLNGSFVTAKIDPKDIDFIAVVEKRVYDDGSPELRTIIDSLIERNSWDFPECCDTNVAIIDGPEYAAALGVLSYWKTRFGFSRIHQTPKGIVTIKVVPSLHVEEVVEGERA